jgi:hypothetical protein
MEIFFKKSVLIIGLIIMSLSVGCESEDLVDIEDEVDGGSSGGSGTGGSSGGSGTGGSSGGTGGSGGGSLVYDGTAEYLTTGNGWLAGDFTICLWMRPSFVNSSGSSGHTLLSMSSVDKYFYLSFDNNELDWKIESENDNDMTIDATTTFTAGSVYHICVTGDYGGTGSRAYVNGAQVGGIPAALGPTPATAHTTLTIGYEPAASFQAGDGDKTQPFRGAMDHVMIWTQVLPANSIAQLYGGGAGFDPQFAFGNYTVGHRSNLYSYYLMGDDPLDVISGGSAVIKDQVGNQDATPLNFESTDYDVSLW